MSKDYYSILGVPRNANSDEIKTAFRKKAHEHHPDKGGDAEKFKEINEAYQILGNAEKKQRYDQFGSAAFDGSAGFGGQSYSGFSADGVNINIDDLGDIFGGFGDIFGFGSSSGASRSQARGINKEITIRLDFLEAIFGVEKEISFSKVDNCKTCKGNGAEPGAQINTCPHCQGAGFITRLQRTILGNIQTKDICPHCNGEGKIPSQKCKSCQGLGISKANTKLKVKIPAGINQGEAIRLSGHGDKSSKHSPAGDLYLRVLITAHKKFTRQGYDIKSSEQISIKQAVLGDKIEIETVHGKLKLKIPAGTQSGTIFKLKDKGSQKLQGRGLGDHYLTINIKIPRTINKKQRSLLEDLDI